jgi:molybdenum cofactor cytidylyltransferase
MLSAILLAAGESRRMGRLKQLLPWGRRTVIEACLENLLNAHVDEVIVVLGHRHEEIQAHLQHLPVRIVVNENYHQGMTSSIQRGVQAVSPDAQAVLIALVDQPMIVTDIINRLIDAYRVRGKQIVIPEYEGRGGHPILIDMAYRDEILNVDPDIGLRQVLRNHPDETLRLPVATGAVVQNMNTWDDYLRLSQRGEEGNEEMRK